MVAILLELSGQGESVKSFSSRAARAEFFGTMVLITLGLGSVAQAEIGGARFGTFLSINLAWGIAVMLAICLTASVSGAHLNPAITLALAVHRKFEWSKVPAYLVAQVLGAFSGAALVYLAYREGIDLTDSGTRTIFATYPAPYLSTIGGLIDQTVGTAVLMWGVLAIADSRSHSLAKNFAPLWIGLIVAGIGMSFGVNAGYAINPARDFGPRLFTAVAGWGPSVFKSGWWWVPILGPIFGAVLGASTYRIFLPETKSAR